MSSFLLATYPTRWGPTLFGIGVSIANNRVTAGMMMFTGRLNSERWMDLPDIIVVFGGRALAVQGERFYRSTDDSVRRGVPAPP